MSSERTQPENGTHFQNLGLARSRAAKFSWTSRFQNLKLHACDSILYNSHQNPRTGSRDITIFVKLFSKLSSHFPATLVREPVQDVCADLVRAVNRQPGLPPGMTRRAPMHYDVHVRTGTPEIDAHYRPLSRDISFAQSLVISLSVSLYLICEQRDGKS